MNDTINQAVEIAKYMQDAQIAGIQLAFFGFVVGGVIAACAAWIRNKFKEIDSK